ncbi:unnamed protein product [Blepharisma stoltei]|uniref:Cytosol aminopeptidase domain-containing protein n=1 Tax=Blepharisma stoltei TaxID=1481888 RepID=A0AAU9ITE7_9CILI|nr:unnamed protein product [Blepharisma stoltei]
MLGFSIRKVHTALKFTHNGPNLKSAVTLFDKEKGAPKSAKLNQAELDDLKTLKSIWTYPKGTYDRILYQELDEKDIFSSANKTITALKARNLENSDVLFPRGTKQEELEIWANTALLKNYKFSAKSSKENKEEENGEEKNDKKELTELNLLHNLTIDESSWNQSIHSGVCALYARDLCNTRGTEGNTEFLAAQAQKLYSDNPGKVEMQVIKGEELRERGMNLLYSVGKGASTPPYLILLKYNGNPQNTKKLALVGKGLTFDTGGLNLKPTNSIEDMYLDKSGACITLSAFKWAVEMSIPINLTCTLAIAENAISHKSYKPLDIIKSLKGLTVEIGNTDAEGRLCLADAFTYTQQQEKPDTLIDLATLTGACVVALGEQTAGIFGNDSALINQIIKSGEFYKEDLWQLPIRKEHKKAIEGAAADINNSGKSRYGGASQAASFLQNFIEKDVKWAHLDIAGPAMSKADREQFSKGGTGFGTQTLTKYIQKRVEEEAKASK